MKRKAVGITLAIFLTITITTPVQAAQWKQYETTWKYEKDNGDLAIGWNWISGESYYFDNSGSLLMATTTPDGYQVNENGEWVVNGVIQTQEEQGEANATLTVAQQNMTEAYQRLRAAGGGSYQEAYVDGGMYEQTDKGVFGNLLTEKYARSLKDPSCLCVAPTGVIYIGSKGTETIEEGVDKSLLLDYDPSEGVLKPNWEYNPSEELQEPAPVLCMNKVVAREEVSWGDYPVDTSGSWVYDTIGSPSGTIRWQGEISRWRYRFADGTYAANAMYNIYWRSTTYNHPEYDDFISGNVYFFNEDGFLIINSPRGSSAYIDAGGKIKDAGSIGEGASFGNLWKYKK